MEKEDGRIRDGGSRSELLENPTPHKDRGDIMMMLMGGLLL